MCTRGAVGSGTASQPNRAEPRLSAAGGAQDPLAQDRTGAGVSSEPRAGDPRGETQHQGPPGGHRGQGGLLVSGVCGAQVASPPPSALLVASRVPAVEGRPVSGGSWTRQRPDRHTDKQDLVGASPSNSVPQECPADTNEAAALCPGGPTQRADGSPSAAGWGSLSPTRRHLLFRVNGRMTLLGPCSDGGAYSTLGRPLSSRGLSFPAWSMRWSPRHLPS